MRKYVLTGLMLFAVGAMAHQPSIRIQTNPPEGSTSRTDWRPMACTASGEWQVAAAIEQPGGWTMPDGIERVELRTCFVDNGTGAENCAAEKGVWWRPLIYREPPGFTVE